MPFCSLAKSPVPRTAWVHSSSKPQSATRCPTQAPASFQPTPLSNPVCVVPSSLSFKNISAPLPSLSASKTILFARADVRRHVDVGVPTLGLLQTAFYRNCAPHEAHL